MRLWMAVRRRLFGDDEPEHEPAASDALDHAASPAEAEAPAPPEPEPEPGPPSADVGSGFPERAAADAGAPPSTGGAHELHGDAATVVVRQERAAARILEDERLRRDLTDEEAQPLLDWALGETDRRAASTAGLDDATADARLDAALAAIREALLLAQDAVVAHGASDGVARRAALDALAAFWPPADLDEGSESARADGATLLATLADRLDAEPELSGPEVAALIAQALAPPPDDGSTPSSSAPPGDEAWGVGDSP